MTIILHTLTCKKEANIFKTSAIGISQYWLKISVIRISAKFNEYSPSQHWGQFGTAMPPY